MRWQLKKDAALTGKQCRRLECVDRISSNGFLLLQTVGKSIKWMLSGPASKGWDLALPAWLLIPCGVRFLGLGEQCFRKIRHGCTRTLRTGGQCGALICAFPLWSAWIRKTSSRPKHKT